MDKVVLVVDDDRDFLELMQMLFEDCLGVRVVTVQDGREALTRIKQTKPAVVLLDRQMPGVDGLHILTQLKSDPDTKAIPVVICTAVIFSQEKSEQAGCDEFIEKPFDAGILIAKVERYLIQDT